MIIIKKPFIYLRDEHQWSYGDYGKGRAFMDLNRYMLFELREKMTCEIFRTKKDKKTTKDAKYKIISLLDFLKHGSIEDKSLSCDYNGKCNWRFEYIKLGLKVVRNAEVGIPTKETFPLIIRNKDYNFYIAGQIEGD